MSAPDTTLADTHADEPAFLFTPDNLALAERIIAKYPAGRQASACMPLLDLAQRQNAGYLSRACMDAVADMLSMPRIRVYEVATFYTMFNKAPVGKHVIQVCTTTPCWLRGSDDVVHACERKLGIHVGETTDDGQFTLREVECSGACVNAPVVQIGDDYYEDVAPERMEKIIDALARGEIPPHGSQIGRRSSEPEGGPTTLKAFTTDSQTDH
ncbi:NADH-quinone oxidoreductase subunit NuoE [Azospirillum sp. SYSU D00513]|uniref:NADH-quinone oxidoreductase subunit NuoE n=1 Tax=Azospirillum sp. SYSU D00513 TaxID=2812561 RepID=UPI001A971503|nr:NADH-quinone oxidoreductase subunit NuoE [Azospirillum sp. SYSU D00513]